MRFLKRLLTRLPSLLPLRLVLEAMKVAFVAHLRPYLPQCLRRHRFDELQLVKVSVVEVAGGLHMAMTDHHVLGSMRLAAALLFWILAEQVVRSRR